MSGSNSPSAIFSITELESPSIDCGGTPFDIGNRDALSLRLKTTFDRANVNPKRCLRAKMAILSHRSAARLFTASICIKCRSFD
uniref:Uncharacterized protein n=1 Tax=Rhizobium leguminosarum bv. trifolii TaxID=386 RepID=A0A1C9HZH1_RHILT|nr:hypothetical protein [Rhizobium leguminosarum bv. trifolii]